MSKITIQDMSKHFGEVIAVDKLNLEIEEQEFLTLLGPSGCGKTTTLNIIAGLEEPTEGQVFFRRSRRHPHPTGTEKHCNGISNLCPVSAHARLRQYRLRFTHA